MKRVALVTAALLAAVAVFAAVSLPPASRPLSAFADGPVPGILHVHTDRSDGLSGPDEIAAAAARARLKFVIFTDHGDGTRTPDPPTYRSGVLCIDGVEISTTGGHYLALGLPEAPYPLGGEARDVVEDVQRLGGFGIVAHPDSPKPELAWQDWSAPVDGIELLNLDTGWRVLAYDTGWSPKWRLLQALVAYPIRPREAIASIVGPTRALPAWQSLIAKRRVVVAAGADAHAKLALRNGGLVLPFPKYESSFGVVSLHVKPDDPLSGRADEDAKSLIRAIRAGHLYVALDGLASPPAFEFTASNQHGTVQAGDELRIGGPVLLRVRSNAPSDFTTIVYDGSRALTTVRDAQDLSVHASADAAAYWAEIVSIGQHPQTWIRSNPIYVGDPVPSGGPMSRTILKRRPLFDGRSSTGWQVEHDATSLAAVDVVRGFGREELMLRYGLSGGVDVSQYACLVVETPTGLEDFDRVALTIRGDGPLRVSVQVRTDRNERWQRSIYADASNQERVVSFDDMTPLGNLTTSKPPLAHIRSLMFVIDTNNTKLGASGRLSISKADLLK